MQTWRRPGVLQHELDAGESLRFAYIIDNGIKGILSDREIDNYTKLVIKVKHEKQVSP